MKAKIKVTKNGPYIVTGNVKLSEKIITSKGKTYEYQKGRTFVQSEEYALCRCGKSKDTPFCDGSHTTFDFDGTETASRDSYIERAEVFEGPEELNLLDDNRCAFARFCHREGGNAWELIENSDDPTVREEAIRAACECPSGRLVVRDKSGKEMELPYTPSIDIIQDPERKVSAGIFVKGKIPIESADGNIYEIRNRTMLCRCGRSRNKPFCDATHVQCGYLDNL
ncbi:MAG: CDGSH iron-sulfur domain-containing protein [Lachnospiraceae bacterium]|nr:CDGSH iron-sulfur domain-containing protein [Lachnospiraceae bacterium]